MSDLVGNPKDQFSRDAAYMYFVCCVMLLVFSGVKVVLEQRDIRKKSMREKARYLQGAYNQQLAAEKAKQLVGILWAFKMNVFCILWSVVT